MDGGADSFLRGEVMPCDGFPGLTASHDRMDKMPGNHHHADYGKRKLNGWEHTAAPWPYALNRELPYLP